MYQAPGPPRPLGVGDRVEVIIPIRIAPGSNIRLEPGDHVTIERLGAVNCVVRVIGNQLAVAPIRALRLVQRAGDWQGDPVLDFLDQDATPRI